MRIKRIPHSMQDDTYTQPSKPKLGPIRC